MKQMSCQRSHVGLMVFAVEFKPRCLPCVLLVQFALAHSFHFACRDWCGFSSRRLHMNVTDCFAS